MSRRHDGDRKGERTPPPRRPATASSAGITLLVFACLSIGCWWVAPVVLLMTHGHVKAMNRSGAIHDPAMFAAYRVAQLVSLLVGATMAGLGLIALVEHLTG